MNPNIFQMHRSLPIIPFPHLRNRPPPMVDPVVSFPRGPRNPVPPPPSVLLEPFPSGKGIVHEYRKAAANICIHPTLMATSQLRKKLEYLQKLYNNKTISMNITSINNSGTPTSNSTLFSSSITTLSIDILATELVRKAFSLSSSALAKQHIAHVEGMDDLAGNVYQGIISLFRELPSMDRNYYLYSLLYLIDYEDITGCQIMSMLCLKASRECAARKRFAFVSLVNRVTLPSLVIHDSTASSESLSTSTSTTSTNTSTITSSTPTKLTLQEQYPHTYKIRQRLYEAIEILIDDMKEKAFQSVFLQPSIAYLKLAGNTTMEGDVEVHGANTYGAIVEYSLGIKQSRLPLLEDECKGIVDYLGYSSFKPIVDALWDDKKFGHSASSLAMVRNISISVPYNHGQSFIFSAGSANAMKDIIRHPAPEYKTLREKLAVYLEKYCYYFSKDYVLEYIFRNLSLDDNYVIDLQTIANEEGLTKLTMDNNNNGNTITNDEEYEDFRYLVWDLNQDPPVFNKEIVWKLFTSLHITKDPKSMELEPFQVEGISTSSSSTSSSSSSSSSSSMEVESASSANLSNNQDINPNWKRINPQAIRLTAAGDAHGGGTGREFLHNLHNDGTEGWNKWLHPGYVTRSWVQMEFTGTYQICRYGLQSANDAPHRDPAAWNLQGRKVDTKEWIPLHTVNSNDMDTRGFTFRWEWKWFNLLNGTDDPNNLPIVDAIRLNITEVVRPGDCLQLGHFHVYGIQKSENNNDTSIANNSSNNDSNNSTGRPNIVTKPIRSGIHVGTLFQNLRH